MNTSDAPKPGPRTFSPRLSARDQALHHAREASRVLALPECNLDEGNDASELYAAANAHAATSLAWSKLANHQRPRVGQLHARGE